jgi:hypothetical protein
MKKEYLKIKADELEEKKKKAKLEKYKTELDELKEKRQIQSKCMVGVDGIGDKEEVTFTGLKESFKEFGEVQFVDWPLMVKDQEDKSKAVIRFKTPEDAAKMVKEMTENGKVIGGGEEKVKVRILEQEEEENILIQTVKNQRNDKFSKKRKGSFRGGRGQKRRKRE